MNSIIIVKDFWKIKLFCQIYNNSSYLIKYFGFISCLRVKKDAYFIKYLLSFLISSMNKDFQQKCLSSF